MSRYLDVPVRKGEVVRQRVKVAELMDGTPVTLPVLTASGNPDGPTLYIEAAIHGDESTGLEVCQQILTGLVPSEMRGTVVAVPVANVPAHITRTRGYLHEERNVLDMYSYFPGNPHGLLTERIAAVLFEQFIRQVDFTIDLHSALDGACIAPFVYVIPADDENGTLKIREQCAWAFGSPYVYYHERGGRFGKFSTTQWNATIEADKAGAPFMMAEMGESRRVTSEYVPIGVRGIRNVMKVLGILDGDPEPVENQQKFTTFEVVCADNGGGLHLLVNPGDDVKEGEPLAEIVDVFGQRAQVLESPADGFVLRTMRFASVSTGAEVAWIGH